MCIFIILKGTHVTILSINKYTYSRRSMKKKAQAGYHFQQKPKYI